jgi:ParB family chromosome partitioning protein
MKGGLGKGIGALIPRDLIKPENTSQQTIVDDSDGSAGIAFVDVDKVRPNPYQPRKEFDPTALQELAASIRVHGVVQPITVRKVFDHYELVSGERRLRAAKLAGLTQIPAYQINVANDEQMIAIAIIENLQRENLNALEVATSYQMLIEEYDLTQDEVAARVGKDRSTVANFLRLLKLPIEVQSALVKRSISMGHARAMAALSDERAQRSVLREVITHDLSVRKTETLVKDIELGRKDISKNGDIFSVNNKTVLISSPIDGGRADTSASVAELENSLRHLLQTQVKLKMKGGEEGVIEIEFYSLEELERLLELFSAIDGTKGS